MRLPKIDKRIIWALILGLAWVALIIAIIYPTAKNIIGIRQEILTERQELEKKLALGLNAKQIKEEAEQTEAVMPQLRKMYIQPDQELDFLNYLDGLAGKYKLLLEVKTDFVGQPLTANITRLPLELTLAGKFDNVLVALNELERQNVYCIIDTLSITAQKDDFVAVALSGNIYRQEAKVAPKK